MSALIAAITAEREQLLAPIAERLAVLDEIERLAAGLGDDRTPPVASVPVPPSDPPSPAGRRATAKPASKPSKRAAATATARVGRDGLGEVAERVLQALRNNGGWMGRGDLLPIVGDFNVRTTQRLVERGLVEAQGSTNSRRYRAARDTSETAGSGPPITGTSAAPVAGGTVARSAAPGVSVAGLDAKATRILRARIVDHLSRRRLNEQSLADHLNAELDHVTALLTDLAAAGDVVLDPDGRYRAPTS